MNDYNTDVNEVGPAPTTAESCAIKAIAKDTVHKICSGQVVLSLAVAVKELVENAIDAGATLVEIKLKDQGLESVEVIDNGSGVEEKNLEGMTAKYHTSKIRSFIDLQGLETFGFRGEALSSLCALSDMTVVTRHRSTDVAIKVELDHEGKIKKRTPCARSIGTTVTLANLFGTLPVRKRDFTRNIKKEFNKMCQILQAYGLVAKGVRIICSNISAKGGKSVIMQTNGTQDVLENITSIFGLRQSESVIKIKEPFSTGQTIKQESLLDVLNDDDDATNLEISGEDVKHLNTEEFQLEGYVSSCSHGSGRSSRDRQYFYVNSRPCEPKNISKMVNEIYHRYNIHQFPFVFLNILTERSQVDVNLTPDKRQLLINNEKILLLVIKKALLNTYGNIPSMYKIQNSTIDSMLKKEEMPFSSCDNTKPFHVLDKEVPQTSTKRFLDVLSQWKHTGDTKGVAPSIKTSKRKCDDEITVRTMKIKKIQDYLTQEGTTASSKPLSYKSSDSETENENEGKSTLSVNQSLLDLNEIKTDSKDFDELTSKNGNDSDIVTQIVCKNVPSVKQSGQCFITANPFVKVIPSSLPLSQESSGSTSHLTQETTVNSSDDDTDGTFVTSQTKTKITNNIQLDDSASEEESAAYSCSKINISLAEIELNLKAEENLLKEQSTKAKLERLRFKSDISPSQNSTAEQELQREISKEMFSKMEVLGQFNLGFIIVKLDTDLFIVDQHATDEKYNFEKLQQSVVLQHQPLTVPQSLDMTAVNEMVLLDNLDIFEKNGFKFQIDENAPATKKVRLLAKPFSKNWEFGKEDIDELIFMLQDAPEGTLCRPSRVRAMFASRACHKSVVIGKALNRQTMKMLITHMGEIEQPWNCPHGRPTMRHLINIAMLQDDN